MRRRTRKAAMRADESVWSSFWSFKNSQGEAVCLPADWVGPQLSAASTRSRVRPSLAYRRAVRVSASCASELGDGVKPPLASSLLLGSSAALAGVKRRAAKPEREHRPFMCVAPKRPLLAVRAALRDRHIRWEGASPPASFSSRATRGAPPKSKATRAIPAAWARRPRSTRV